ncbi:glycosyltransferase [Shewanella sp. Scap07]|uniref:glycosyltransferase family 2 protein n=1 Tax=Shewanella sp. Scap07 TaxID=2589987 RepID=UPI0015BC2B85|nr:glycosyltransferase family 2 protein [Shewanella sp. Scap07]QLE86080.1 glycosyltransferase [Shewanella sp. Scap07]
MRPLIHTQLASQGDQRGEKYANQVTELSIEPGQEARPLITVVVPSFNQGQFLEAALLSIFEQNLPIEVFVMDGGSTDNSIEVIKRYEDQLTGWRSHKDDGQSAAINEGVALGSAPYVCWLNSDDFYYPNALHSLYNRIAFSNAPFVYGKCWTTSENGTKTVPYLTLPFIGYLFANYCFVCQPGTLIRRSDWERVSGLDEKLQMAMDYQLWWKLVNLAGKPDYCKEFVAATRSHENTKTHNNGRLHYQESMTVVKQYWGRVPLKWFITLPLMNLLRRLRVI